MPPKSTLTQRDVEVLAAAFQCQKSPPEIDFDKLAVKVGYKNAQSARACFQETKKRMRAMNDNADDENATVAITKNPTAAKSRKRKQLSSPSDSSTTTLASSSPTQNSDDETTAPKTKKHKARPSRAKKPAISTPETEEEIHNAKAIAAGRARYAADKLAAEVKKEVDDEEKGLGMNVDSGEDEGVTAYQLVKNEVFGEGVEV